MAKYIRKLELKMSSAAKPKVLFLGYPETQTGLIQVLKDQNCDVTWTAEKITTTQGYDLVVSFGYRYILTKSLIDSSSAPIVNLHISYLPYNRGAHPNFWSFFDGTPSGVSIHLIDEGIDTGSILFQKYVNFKENEDTFSKTHKRLVQEIENLFITNVESIIKKTFVARPQRRKGTYHRVSDLPKEFLGWDTNIYNEITRLDKILKAEKS